MKVQDILFIFILGLVFWSRRPVLAVILGVTALCLAVILFKFSILFTAERLTWYAGALFLYTIIFNLTQLKK